MLSIPSQELSEQSNASKSLNELLSNSDTMNSQDILTEIENWQKTYPLNTFPTRLKKDLEVTLIGLNKIVTQKDTEETAIQKVQDYLSSMDKPAEDIPKLLAEFDFSNFSDETKLQITNLTFEAISLQELTTENSSATPTTFSTQNIPHYQQSSLNELKDIFDKSNTNYSDLFNWIYINRKISFVPDAIDEIKKLFIDAGYPIPKYGEYHMPSISEEVTAQNINDTMKEVVFNYIGLLYTKGEPLSSTEQNKIVKTYSEKEA